MSSSSYTSHREREFSARADSQYASNNKQRIIFNQMHKDKNSAMNSEAANYAKQQIIMADAEIKIAGLRVFVARHTLYHVSQSLVLGLLLALYGVRVFANDDLDGRSKCTNGDTDVTGLVRTAF